jgi:hypothetical protein
MKKMSMAMDIFKNYRRDNKEWSKDILRKKNRVHQSKSTTAMENNKR